MAVKIASVQSADDFSPAEERWRDVPVAIAVDIDTNACQIDPAIRPLCPPGRQPRLFGRAVTALCEPGDLGSVLYATDQITPGDVLVIALSESASPAVIGEILCGHVRRRGGVGVVTDGAVRDVAELSSWGDFSVYSTSINPFGPTSADSGAVNVPVTLGGQKICPGDIILGDDDGLARLAPDMVQGFIEAAEAKLALEAEWIRRLGEGEPVADIFGLDKPV